MAIPDNHEAGRDSDRTRRIGVIALDGGLTVSVAGLVDVFALANRWCHQRAPGRPRRFDIAVLGASAAPVRSFTGYPVAVDGELDAWTGDVLICSAVAIDPVVSLGQNAELVASLARRRHARGLTVASVCTGAFFLAEAGLLSGRSATTNPLFARALAARHPDVRLTLARVLVDEGVVITAGTVAAGLNLALYLVERYAGIEIATLTAKSMAVDKNRDTQAPYLIPSMRLEEGDTLPVKVQRWIEAHHADAALTLDAVASAQGVTPRTLQRRFRAATGDTPMAYARLVRLEAAKRLLESADRSIEEITWTVGYRDARSFTRLFRAHAGTSPSDYRARFGSGVATGPAPGRSKDR